MHLRQRLDKTGVKGFALRGPHPRVRRNLHRRLGPHRHNEAVPQHHRAAFNHHARRRHHARPNDRVHARTRFAQPLDRRCGDLPAEPATNTQPRPRPDRKKRQLTAGAGARKTIPYRGERHGKNAAQPHDPRRQRSRYDTGNPFFPRPLAPPNSGGNISVTFRKPPRLSEPRTACFPPAQFRESFIAPT